MLNSKIDAHLNGQYSFDIKAILTRATALTRENHLILFTALAMTIGASMFASVLLVKWFGINSINEFLQSDDTWLAMSLLVSNVFFAPMWAAIAMISIYSLRNLKVSSLLIFGFYHLLPILGLVSLLIDMVSNLALQLFVIPALYVYMASTFVIPLIIDKGLRPMQAIILSLKMTNAYLINMAVIYLILLALLIAGLFSFGIAYIWILPFIYNVKAVLYEDLFGDEVAPANKEAQVTGVFDA